MTNPIDLATLQAYAEVYAGCDSCDADVVVEEVDPGIFMARIMHDDGCPVLAWHEARR